VRRKILGHVDAARAVVARLDWVGIHRSCTFNFAIESFFELEDAEQREAPKVDFS